MANISSLLALDDMLLPILNLIEGQAATAKLEEDARELRHRIFPVTRQHIYLNHAATGGLPEPVAYMLREYIDNCNSAGGLYEERWRAYRAQSYDHLASMLRARPDQIALTSSTGDGLMMIAEGLDWREGDIVLTAQGEFPSNVYSWLNLQRYGVEVQMVPTRDHRIATEDVLAAITDRTRLVSLSLVEFSTGYRNDIATIARYCHERGILCGIDAMQALGVLDIDVQHLAVDYLAAAAHKWLLAPHTTGILYVADELMTRLHTRRRGWFSVEDPMDFFNYQQPLKVGAHRFEHSSVNFLPSVGLSASLNLFANVPGGMAAIEERVLGLTTYVLSGLTRLGYPVISPQGSGERSGIVCFMPHPARQDLAPQQIVQELTARQIAVAARGSVVRVSPHFYNTLSDIDTLLNALEDLKNVG
ncbi:MAG TPA: aminotransferase class V-fold PLP-dependent enzyme [Ktedonosporobacter sp.]|nr:aminotransferase class V-fold PLP-dependent enzyme [Ktedonosporobacter sp.]